MKVTFVTTVYNEEATMKELLTSLSSQSRIPDEIIIVDGGSTDATASVISNFILSKAEGPISNKKIKFKFIIKKGNRAVGRNEAISRSTNEIIACSDAGCILDKNWIKNIVKPFEKKDVDVVAGYYKGNAKTIFQKCLIPYVLVMEDKVNPNNFLPATRSMAFKKSVWQKVGGFPEEFSNNEDYVFAKKLKKINANIVFEKKAIVYWTPRSSLEDAFAMFYRFAKGDAESHIFRPRMIILFSRYIIGLFLIVFYVTSKLYIILHTLYLILFAYVLWAIIKNFKYIKLLAAVYYLPLIQISSDLAIMLGTIKGFFSSKNTNAK